jgi:hypothetical protein
MVIQDIQSAEPGEKVPSTATQGRQGVITQRRKERKGEGGGKSLSVFPNPCTRDEICAAGRDLLQLCDLCALA